MHARTCARAHTHTHTRTHTHAHTHTHTHTHTHIFRHKPHCVIPTVPTIESGRILLIQSHRFWHLARITGPSSSMVWSQLSCVSTGVLYPWPCSQQAVLTSYTVPQVLHWATAVTTCAQNQQCTSTSVKIISFHQHGSLNESFWETVKNTTFETMASASAMFLCQRHQNQHIQAVNILPMMVGRRLGWDEAQGHWIQL